MADMHIETRQTIGKNQFKYNLAVIQAFDVEPSTKELDTCLLVADAFIDRTAGDSALLSIRFSGEPIEWATVDIDFHSVYERFPGTVAEPHNPHQTYKIKIGGQEGSWIYTETNDVYRFLAMKLKERLTA